MRTDLGRLIAKAVRSRLVRAALAIAGVGTSTLLVLVLFAAYRSPVASVRAYTGQPGVDLWIGPAGSDNIVRSSGVLPGEVLDGVRTIAGIEKADPVLRTFVSVTRPAAAIASGAKREKMTMLALGYVVPDGLAGPPAFAAGHAPEGENQVAIDRAAAFRLGVVVGDVVRVNGRNADVVGITRGTNLIITQFMFADIEAAERAAGLDRKCSFIAARLAPGADGSVVGASIVERFPETAVYTREEFLANNLREGANGFVPVLTLVAALGIAMSSVLIALLVQGMVDDRRADIAVLLAMGAATGRLALALVLHATALVVIGSALGAIAARLLVAALSRFLPTIELTLLNGDLAFVAAVFCVAGMLGAAVPVLRLNRVDPLEAFR